MGKPRILIVEDEKIVVEDIRDGLSGFGYHVCSVASNGQEAIQKASSYRPDLVLIDIHLKGEMNGIEAARQIIQQHYIPVIYITARTDPATLEQAKLTEPEGYILKPFIDQDLHVAIQMALARSRSVALIKLPSSPIYFHCQQTLACNQMENFKINLAVPQWKDTLNDLTVDILDIIATHWLNRASAQDNLSLHADDFLRFRGLKAQKSGSGRRGGFQDAWRKKVAKNINILSNIQFEKSKNPLISTQLENGNPYHWKIRWNENLIPIHHTFLLPQKILTYNPYQQKCEKRLGRYLIHQWNHCKKFESVAPISVESCLDVTDIKIDIKNPGRTRKRLESALNTLVKDSVILGWKYTDYNDNSPKGWLNHWLNSSIIVDPPERIVNL